MSENSGRKPYIMCCGEHGRAVIFCWLDDEPTPGESIVMHDARMVLYWSRECGGLFGLATGGPKTGTRITAPVRRIVETVWKEALSVSERAAQMMGSWKAV